MVTRERFVIFSDWSRVGKEKNEGRNARKGHGSKKTVVEGVSPRRHEGRGRQEVKSRWVFRRRPPEHNENFRRKVRVAAKEKKPRT